MRADLKEANERIGEQGALPLEKQIGGGKGTLHRWDRGRPVRSAC